MLNQNTHIKVFNHRQRIVFVIDMSQSMLTVDVSDRARVNMTTAFETVCKTVDGLLRPFEFVTQFREATVQPDLRITVVGDPGPDGLIRVLMQDIPITRQQFDPFIEKLYDLMIEFENELLEKRTKTDYSSFRSLGDALLMLDLDPDDRQQTIVFLTNGVCCAGSDRKEICSRMVSRMVHVVVIQIGAPDGFTPSAEFGRVSNMDWVQFLVQACNGLFIYSGDCPYTQDQTDPNFYHLLYLFKPELGSHTQQEYPLRPVDELPVRLINSNHSNQQTKDEQGFPWLKDTKAPGITKILCGYKDYKIPFQQLKHLIHSRLSQGFILQHCKHRKKTEKNSEKLELTFVLYWLPNVNVDYTIKIYWESNTDLFQGDRKPIRVELNVLAHHSFAVLFINVHDIESQDVKNSLHNRLVQLHKFLRDIYETDETIKFLTENPSASNYWQILSQFLMIKPDILDTKRLSVVLQSTSQLVHQSDRAVQVANGSVEQGRSRRQVATIYLYQHLARWASFVWNKTFYIKMTETGYCFLQVIWETESLVSIVGSFMGLDLPMQDQVWQSLEQEISGIVHLRNQKPFSPIIVYRKPLDLLIVYEKIQARPFLRSKTWEWFHNMQSSKPLTRMVQLGFQMLYQDRLEEGFKHLAESVGSATFCKSVQVQERELVIQYCIEWNLSKNTLKTQLWMETSWIYDNGFMDWFEKIQQKIYYRVFHLTPGLFESDQIIDILLH
ncbi:hypothetical protein EDD86DRAFT_80939 [Gorgonomyces haynaldii]|nr:hypothetical protein EDD86DRAFT_80939 [Gorgonomyces haynaldii]